MLPLPFCPYCAAVEAAANLGLAPVVGSSGTVGAVGYTLGGGIGPLIRSHGFSSDGVRADVRGEYDPDRVFPFGPS